MRARLEPDMEHYLKYPFQICNRVNAHRLRRCFLYTRVPATYNERKFKRQCTTQCTIVQPNSHAPDLRAKHLTTFSCTQGETSDLMAGKHGGDTKTASPGSPMPALNLALWLQSNTLWCRPPTPPQRHLRHFRLRRNHLRSAESESAHGSAHWRAAQ